jgi:hypothetical protein
MKLTEEQLLKLGSKIDSFAQITDLEPITFEFDRKIDRVIDNKKLVIKFLPRREGIGYNLFLNTSHLCDIKYVGKLCDLIHNLTGYKLR